MHYRRGLVDACRSAEVVPEAYSPLGTGRHLYNRSHKHETHYVHKAAVNESYCAAAEKLAPRIEEAIAPSRRCLVYLPLRGALPIWRAVKRHLRRQYEPGRLEEYHAVTSSFVMYPRELEMTGKHGGPAGGRYANILELKRLRDWCIGPMGFDHLLYVDEIISGGMMRSRKPYEIASYTRRKAFTR